MHISDGVLPLEPTIIISAISAIALIKALRSIKEEEIPLTAVASAMFFIATFIHIPLGVTQIHLVLLGIIGIMIGWSSFLSIFIALLLQALLLGYGGLVSLGVNLFIMATPTILVYYINKLSFFQNLNDKLKFFLIGFLGAFFASVFLSVILYFGKDEYEYAAYTILSVNTITMVIEGIVSMFLLLFIQKVYPKILKV